MIDGWEKWKFAPLFFYSNAINLHMFNLNSKIWTMIEDHASNLARKNSISFKYQQLNFFIPLFIDIHVYNPIFYEKITKKFNFFQISTIKFLYSNFHRHSRIQFSNIYLYRFKLKNGIELRKNSIFFKYQQIKLVDG